MFNISKQLGLFALVCMLAGLAGCGSGAGTDSKKQQLTVCTGNKALLADGTCGAPPTPPDCPEGFIRNSQGACVESTFKKPTYPETLAADEAVIYLNRPDKKFDGYSLHLWNTGTCPGAWASSVPTTWPVGPAVTSTGKTGAYPEDPIYGAYFIVKLSGTPGITCADFLLKKGTGGGDAQTGNLKMNITGNGPLDRRFYIISESDNLHEANTNVLPICINNRCEAYVEPSLAISGVSAHWVDQNTLLWSRNLSSVALYKANPGETMSDNADGSVKGGTKVATLTATSLTSDQSNRTPHLKNYVAYSVALNSGENIKDLLKKELLVVGFDRNDTKLDEEGNPVKDENGQNILIPRYIGTRLQKQYLLDDVYAASAANAVLGVSYSSDKKAKVSVWAPTATSVELRLFADTPRRVGEPLPVTNKLAMNYDANTGVWSYSDTDTVKLNRKFYRFFVTGYNATTNKIEEFEVTDPASVSLSTNGLYSQVVDLDDISLKPDGWDTSTATLPVLPSQTAISIYEAHVRDFSIEDASTDEKHRGKYLAFTDENSAPVQHLKALQQAGLTHVHLLPVNDASEINEDFSAQINLDSKVFELCLKNKAAPVCGIENNVATLRSVIQRYTMEGDSDKAQKLIDSFRSGLDELDGFNWNYDPMHFNAPEGSYATDPNGVARIIEMRKMNMALHKMNLRVVYDVVYPHMKAGNLNTVKSTFEKVVPGYYFRTNLVTGTPEEHSAGPATASELKMMDKFIKDSLVQWAVQYKVDGFRFDQSGYLTKSVLQDSYAAVKQVDPDTYFYAEAWSATEGTSVTRIAESGNQAALVGTGIGTFNNRIRDSIRDMSIYGATSQDRVRAGLAGNLADFKLLLKSGKTVKASTVGAYNQSPEEAINYADVHDGVTLWDWDNRYIGSSTPTGDEVQLQSVIAADTTTEQRVRLHNLKLSIPALSQGVPFFMMGSELLRSKSLSDDSYNANEWFNRVDFTMQTNNWRVGVPPKQQGSLEQILAAFTNPLAKVEPENIAKASAVFNDFLKISKSPLFSLTTAAEIKDRVGFHDGGATQVDNLIVMSIDDGAGKIINSDDDRLDLDTEVDAIVVVFNGTKNTITHKISTATGFTLHPIQKNSTADDIVKNSTFADGTGGDAGKGIFTVPAYTTAVFVKTQTPGIQGAGLLSTVTSGYEAPVPYGEDGIHARGGFPAGWSASMANKLSYQGNNIYSGFIDVTATGPATYNFLIGGVAGDFSDHKFGGGAVTLGAPLTLTPGGADLSISLAAGSYSFKLDATNPAAPILTVTDTDVYKATPFHARGGLTGDWNAVPANKLIYLGRNVYDLTAPVQVNGQTAAYEFKFGDDDWNPEAGSGADGKAIALDTAKVLTTTGGQNLEVEIPVAKAGLYSVRLNTADPLAPVASVYKADMYNGTSLYVRGSFNSWGATAELTYEGHGRYSKTITLTKDVAPRAFKIADSGWTSGTNFGATNTTLGIELGDSGEDILVEIIADGDYKFTLDTATKPHKITVSKVN